jgi:hypothetical protein
MGLAIIIIGVFGVYGLDYSLHTLIFTMGVYLNP